MKILAIDTSAVTATACIADENKTLGEISYTTALTHSQTIMPMIDELLKNLNLSSGDIDVFACSNGPGSFTGLRIGIGTIKGLAFGADKPVIGISTLEALSYNVPFSDCIISPIMDARRNQVYNAFYRFINGKMECILEPRAISIEDLALEVKEKTVFVGDGVLPYKEKLTELLGDNALFAPNNLCLQRASSVAAAAFGKEAIHPRELTAIYLRKSQAERELEEKIKKE